MTRRFIADRDDELALLDDILHPDAPRRILLLEAESGLGKTLLLEEYQTRIRTSGHRLAVIDLAVGGMGVADVLSAVCDEWGWEEFPRFQAAIEALLRPRAEVDVHGVVQIGRPQLQVVMSAEDAAQRQARARRLTTAWIDDVRAWLSDAGPAVIMIDTYNLQDTPQRPATVDTELRTWLEGVFLNHVRRTTSLRLVLAGQQTPAPNLAWEGCCHRYQLGPIDDPDEWMPFAESIGARVDRTLVSAYCHTEEGHPFAIATRLGMLCSWEGVA